jgi:hypothetical protein
MHYVVPYFCIDDPAAREALLAQAPASLTEWLADAYCVTANNNGSGEQDYASGYEYFLAHCLGEAAADGVFPHAALARHWAGLNAQGAWGELRLVHWQVRREDIVLHPQFDLQVTQAEHSAIEQSIAPLLAEDGFTLHMQMPGVWHIAGTDLEHLQTATPARAAGRDMRSFLPKSQHDAKAAQKWRRIANEMQMLLYNHPVNDAREATGILSLNAVWLSGCGVLPSPAPVKPNHIVFEQHITPLLQGNYVEYMQFIVQIISRYDTIPVTLLTLCGEQGWVSLEHKPRGKLARMLGRKGARLQDLLALI